MTPAARSSCRLTADRSDWTETRIRAMLRAGLARPVEFSSRSFADVVVARPAGRIDHAAAGPLENQLMPLLRQAGDGQGALVLDLSNVEYISSVGLRVLMIAAKSMRTRERPIVVAALQPVVTEIFAISRFDKVLTVFPSVRSALEKISAAALAEFDATGVPGAA